MSMSATRSPNPASPPIDVQVRQITANILRRIYEGTASKREISIAIEANQRYAEYLEFLKSQEAFMHSDPSILIEVKGTKVKFRNENDFANWLGEQL